MAGLGIDVNADAGHGMTLMFFAAATGQVAIMQCLKALGAEVNVNARGMTPLSIAESEGQIEAAKWLRANGA